MTDTAPRWGRARWHRIQHAWFMQPIVTGGAAVAKPLCGRTNGRYGGIDYGSDAARCETCERRMAKLGHA